MCVRIGETRATEVNSQLPDVFREKSECMAIEAESEELPRRQARTRRDVWKHVSGRYCKRCFYALYYLLYEYMLIEWYHIYTWVLKCLLT